MKGAYPKCAEEGAGLKGTHVHDWDGLFAWRTEIFDHVLDEHAALGDLAL
jgi:hypothetical protein